jgi:hypothetical protein
MKKYLLLTLIVPMLVGCEAGRTGNPDVVQVFIGSGHTQCNNDGLTLAQTQMILVQNGVDVLGSACGTITGIGFASVCGGPTGEINIHQVRRVNLADAERLGFRNVAAIGRDGQVAGTGFQEEACPTAH